MSDPDLERWEPLCRAIASQYFAPGHESEDLLQEARIGVVKALRDYRPSRGALPPFVGLCVRRQVITAVKTATRGKQAPLNFSQRIAITPDGDEIDVLETIAAPASAEPFEQLATRERRTDLQEALGGLPDFERRALMGTVNGASYVELAVEEKRTPKAIDNAIQRGLRKLRGPVPTCKSVSARAPERSRGIELRMAPISTTLDQALTAELEILDARRGDLQRELDALDATAESIRAFATHHRDGGEPATVDRAPKPKSRPAPSAPARSSGTDRVSNAERGRQLRERVVKHMRTNGVDEVRPADIAKLLGISHSGAATQLARLCSGPSGPLRIVGTGGKGDPKRYRLREASSNGSGDGSPIESSSPAPARRRASPKPPPSDPAVPSDAERQVRQEAGQGTRNRVLDHVRAHPGQSGTEISKALGLDQGTTSSTLTQLARNSKVRSERDGRSKHWYAAEASLARGNGNGGRSKLESAIIDALDEPRTTDGPGGIFEVIDYAPKPSIRSIREVADGLVRRGVLDKREGRYVAIQEPVAA